MRGNKRDQGRVTSRPISINLPEIDGRSKTNSSNEMSHDVTRVPSIRTTGFFHVPSGEGNIIELHVMMSSHATVRRSVDVVIDEKVGDSVRQMFFQRISVAPGGGRQIVIGDVENKTIKVGIRPVGTDGLFPSVAVTQTFRADGAILVLLFKSPAFFVPVSVSMGRCE